MSSLMKTFALGKFVRPNPPKPLLSSLSKKKMEASDPAKTTDISIATPFEMHTLSP